MKQPQRTLPPPLPAQPDNFVYIPNNHTLLRYNQALYQRFSYADNFGLALDDDDRAGKQGKPVLLSKLFVPPKLAETNIPPEQLIETELDKDKQKTLPQRFDFHQVLKEHQRCFILGDPGTGKSTLVNWLMLELSFSGDNLCKAALGSLVPFALILRDMDLAAITTWEDLLQSWSRANKEFGAILDNDPDTLNQVVQSGQALFLLDGLDEISNRETRDRLGRALIDGMGKCPCCRFVITSRIIGFSIEELLGIDEDDQEKQNQSLVLDMDSLTRAAVQAFQRFPDYQPPVYYLSSFDLDQVGSFCRNWYSQYVVPGSRKQGAGNLMERLRLHDGLAGLARIPVLLNLICFIHARRGRLPDGRAELYRRIAETYLTGLDQARGLRFQDQTLRFDYADLHSWLGRIAWDIQEHREEDSGSVVIGRTKVVSILQEGIVEAGFDEGEAEEETDFILDYIAQRSGLFVPRGESDTGEVLYAFSHLSFMEYFAAAHLRSLVEFWDMDGREWQQHRQRMEQPVWKEVLLILFELMDNPTQVEQYLARLVGSKSDSLATADNYMPVLEKPYLEVEIWSGFYAWGVLAEIIMDTAIKFKPQVRQKYVKVLWRFTLSNSVQKSLWGIELVIEHLWSEKQGSLAEFREQAKDIEQLRVSDRVLSDVSPLTHFTRLDLSFTTVHDVTPLSKLVNLTGLGLNITQVSDITPLSSLSNLTNLGLSFTQISDITPLSILVNLTNLQLWNTEISDITPLSSLINLTILNLEKTAIHDITPLSTLVNLTNLKLRHTQVSSITPLKRLVNLTNLDLSYTQIGDIAVLNSLVNLTSLDLSNTQVSTIDVKNLERKLKNCKILL